MVEDFLHYIEDIMERKLEPYEIEFLEKLVDRKMETAVHELLYGCGNSEQVGIVATSGAGLKPAMLIPDVMVGLLIPDVMDRIMDTGSELSHNIELLSREFEESFIRVEQHNQRQNLFRERRGYHDARKIKPQWKMPATALARSKLLD